MLSRVTVSIASSLRKDPLCNSIRVSPSLLIDDWREKLSRKELARAAQLDEMARSNSTSPNAGDQSFPFNRSSSDAGDY